jgi:nucleoid-associated protein YgaU
MGKEVKIGLGVIVALLLVFGTLLARKLATSEMATDAGPVPTAAHPIAPAASREKPQVVTAQKGEPHAASISKGMWGQSGHGGEGHAETSSDVPRANYLPDDRATAEEPVADRYGNEEQTATVEETSTERPVRAASSNPFQRRMQAGGGNEPRVQDADARPNMLPADAHEATALEPRREEPVRTARQPVRRLSAEMPLDEADNSSAIATPDLAAEPATDVDVAAGEPQLAAMPARDEDAPLETAVEPEVSEPVAQPRYRSQVPAERRVNNTTEPVTQDGKYTIQPNDTLWTVSEKVYGNGRYFKAIAEHNRGKYPHPDRLTVGTVISVPPVATLEQNYPGLVPKQRKSAMVASRTVQASARQRMTGGANVYVVEEGDTLFDIARYELGKASRWAEIYDLNREVLGEDFDYLQPGTELAMPAKASGGNDPITQRNPGYQR